MVKLILMGIIVAASASAGFIKSRDYSQKVSELKNLISALQYLETEIKCTRDPLEDIFCRISHYGDGLSFRHFGNCSEMLHRCEGGSLRDIWSCSLKETYRGSVLNFQELACVREFGTELGKCTADEYEPLFGLVKSRLESSLKDAVEQSKTKGKMYRGIGLTAGIALAILIF